MLPDLKILELLCVIVIVFVINFDVVVITEYVDKSSHFFLGPFPALNDFVCTA